MSGEKSETPSTQVPSARLANAESTLASNIEPVPPISPLPSEGAGPAPSARVAAPSATVAEGLMIGGHEVRVFNPSSSGSKTPSDLDDAFFEPTLSDVQAHHASVVARSRRLNEAPLLTSKHRDEERAEREKRKAEKWPTTTIRIRFSDGTQIQSTFPSSSPIQPVYAFVRSALNSEASKPFVLWQPPRFTYPERPVLANRPNPHKATIVAPGNYGAVRGGPTQGLMGGTGGTESLNELGLVPQSVLMVKWEDEGMNASGYPAPLLPELLKRSEPLPAAVPKEEAATKAAAGTGTTPSSGAAKGDKKMPKWLQKGLLKKK